MLGSDHFIEASAGTGKTYTIEQEVKRLICDERMSLEQILIVTFTNAATFELKERIRGMLAKEGILHFGEEAIYTIHGFCQKALRDHPFEASFPFEMVDPSPDLLKQIGTDLLQGELSFLHPKQLETIMALHRHDTAALVHHLVRLVGCRVPIQTPPTFWECDKAIQPLLQGIDREAFLEDLIALAPYYGKMCGRDREIKPEILRGLTLLSEGRWIESPILAFEAKNRLKKKGDPILHYPKLVEQIVPIASIALNPYQILALIGEKMRIKAEEVIAESESIFFEDLILKMRANLNNLPFVTALRNQYKVVIMDEFQDTDPEQWEIFSSLFLHHSPLYLVGDPKQAIYRFRRADIYTYLKAKSEVAHIETLDTNYRSTPALVEGLNYLFSDLTFPLPRLKSGLPYQPVKAGKKEENLLPPIVLLRCESEEALFHKVVDAIRAHPGLTAAVLVKDRYQAERFKACCPLPLRMRRARSLLASPAATLMEELLRAILSPHDQKSVQLLLQGRLASCHESDIWRWHERWKQEGILCCMVDLLRETGPALLAQPRGEELYHDLLHFAEKLEERDDEDLLEAFDALLQEDPDQEGLRGRQLSEEHAVEVMTTHVSKGLEFDLVFPIGLALAAADRRDLVYADGMLTADESEWEAHLEELAAERVRQLYVACTRPKKRLYLPLIEGEDSPIARLIEEKDFPELEEPPTVQQLSCRQLTPPLPRLWNPPRAPVVSFSSLVHTAPYKKTAATTFPAGAEVGVILHRILEHLPFQSPATPATVFPFLMGTLLEPHVEEVTRLIERARTTSLPGGFTLADIDPNQMIREMPFLYPYEGGYCKGVIDLVFQFNRMIYLIDWKSNVVEGSLQDEVDHHHYAMQAALYREAIKKSMPPDFKSKILFFFLRKEQDGIIDLSNNRSVE